LRGRQADRDPCPTRRSSGLAQAGTTGILVNYTGGKAGVAIGSDTEAAQAQTFLSAIEPVLPGATAAWNGRVTRDFWTGYEWTRRSEEHTSELQSRVDLVCRL